MEKRLNLIEKLQNKENFTSAESCLADYILNNIDDVYRMSLQDLAKASYMSKPSVIRLYRKVGCQNYREFSIGLQLEKIKNDDETIEKSRVFMETEDLFEYLQRVGVLFKHVVDDCVSVIDRDSLEDIVAAFYDAKNIYLYSLDGRENILELFLDQMKQAGKEVILIRSSDDPKALIASMDDKDAILIVSALEMKEDDVFLDEILKRPCPKVLVSTADDSDLYSKADHVFYDYPKGNNFIRNSRSVPQVSLLLGLDLLQAAFVKMTFDRRSE